MHEILLERFLIRVELPLPAQWLKSAPPWPPRLNIEIRTTRGSACFTRIAIPISITVLASAVTDAGGHFVLPRTRNLTVRYLHVEAKGFDPLQIVVKRRSTAPAELRVTLHLGA
jgi:hypothetical protein